jgi:hypothetical protein
MACFFVEPQVGIEKFAGCPLADLIPGSLKLIENVGGAA